MQSKLEQLKKVIQEANSDILKQGIIKKHHQCSECGHKDCVRSVKGGWRCLNCNSQWTNAKNPPFDRLEPEIIPRQITLADVLIAINKAKTDWYNVAVDWNGNFIADELQHGDFGKDFAGIPITSTSQREWVFTKIPMWNLKDDNLDHQSEEFINFLWELLCQK